MSYIKLRKELPEDPRLAELAEKLEGWWAERAEWTDAFSYALGDASRYALLGVTVTLWAYADTHIRDDDTLPISITALSRLLKFPEEILRQFPAEWLQVRSDGSIYLPGYRERNDLISRDKRKERARERTRKWRKSRDAVSDASPKRHTRIRGDASVTPRDASHEGASLSLSQSSSSLRSEEDKRARKRAAPLNGKGSRTVPGDFVVTADMAAWAEAKYPTVNHAEATARFRDHEFPRPYHDWPKAWRNWIRKSSEMGPFKSGARVLPDGSLPPRQPREYVPPPPPPDWKP